MIYIEPQGGLCNRLRVIDSAIKLTKEYKDSLVILWKNNHEIGCNFEDIFESFVTGYSGNIVDVKNVTCSKEKLEDYFIDKIGKKRCFIGDTITDAVKFVKCYQNNDGKGDFFLATCFDFYGSGQEYDWLILKEDLKKEVDCIVDRYGNYCVGIHIRRTDQILSIKYSPIEIFEKAMVKEIDKNDEVKFYLATDDEEVKSYYLSKFGERIITIENLTISRNNLTGMENAVIELYALANTKKIYGSYRSSFSYTASLIGRKELDILIDEKEVEIIKRKWDETKLIIEKFKRIMIYGAGLYAKQIYEFLKAKGYLPVYFVVSDVTENEKEIDGIEVKGAIELINEEKSLFILAVKDFNAKKEIRENLENKGFIEILDFNIDIVSAPI